MSGRVIVKGLGPVVRGVQTFTTATRHASLTVAVQYLQSTIDGFGYCLMVDNIGIPWHDRTGVQRAYIVIDPADAAELEKEES